MGFVNAPPTVCVFLIDTPFFNLRTLSQGTSHEQQKYDNDESFTKIERMSTGWNLSYDSPAGSSEIRDVKDGVKVELGGERRFRIHNIINIVKIMSQDSKKKQ